VFCREDGTPCTKDALNWQFGKITRRAGIGYWHAHESRHTAVSIMSNNGVPIQGHQRRDGPQVHPRHRDHLRHVIAPAIRGGAEVMDDVFREE
jgi:integrase